MHDSASPPSRNGLPANDIFPERFEAMAERILRNILPKARKNAADNAFPEIYRQLGSIAGKASFFAGVSGAGLCHARFFAGKDKPRRRKVPECGSESSASDDAPLYYNAETGVFEIRDGKGRAGKTPGAPVPPPPDAAPVVLTFRSDLPSSAPGHWTAELTLPAIPGGLVSFRLLSPAGASGTLHFCGAAVPVLRGRATVPLSILRDRLSAASVAFAPDGAPPSPGAPILAV